MATPSAPNEAARSLPGEPAPTAREDQFRVMNTAVHIQGTAQNLRPWFCEVEETLTRFDPQSPLSQLNRHGGRWTVVPLLLYRAIARALDAAQITSGAFDPTILPALEAAGYSRSFELGPTPAATPVPAGRWSEIRLDPMWQAVWLPEGVRLDLGGIGKGVAVDGALIRTTEPVVLINAGGDLAVRTGPQDGPFLVDVEDPWDGERVLTTFALRSGAAATSSTLGRRWGAGLHHIIHPKTGRPAATEIVAATVVAESAVQAEVLAKACTVLGREDGLALLSRIGCDGLLVTADRQLISTSLAIAGLGAPDAAATR